MKLRFGCSCCVVGVDANVAVGKVAAPHSAVGVAGVERDMNSHGIAAHIFA